MRACAPLFYILFLPLILFVSLDINFKSFFSYFISHSKCYSFCSTVLENCPSSSCSLCDLFLWPPQLTSWIRLIRRNGCVAGISLPLSLSVCLSLYLSLFLSLYHSLLPLVFVYLSLSLSLSPLTPFLSLVNSTDHVK